MCWLFLRCLSVKKQPFNKSSKFSPQRLIPDSL
jgi:hypothetical protein